jgi:tubulin polyglutamylase TTLL4
LDPLRIYLYGDGLVRFASRPFNLRPAELANRCIHLTNFHINKASQATVLHSRTLKN